MSWQDRIIEIVTMRIGDLAPNPRPFLRWSEEYFEGQSAALAALGKTRIIRAYRSERSDGSLTLLDLDGEALRTLDAEEAWRVAILDLTDAEADLARPLEYRLAQLVEVDEAALTSLAGTLDIEDPILQALLCDDLLAQALDVAPGSGGDDFDTTPHDGPTRCQLGELWIIGNVHRLIIGDSTDSLTVTRLLGKDKPLLLITDPPYGVDYDQEWRSQNRIGKVTNDDRHDWREAYMLAQADIVYCWHASRYASAVQDALESAAFVLRAQIIWAKKHMVLSRGHYHWQHEPCWYGVRDGATAQWAGDRTQTTVWSMGIDPDVEGGHSTQKPLECMARPMRNHGQPGDIVYDPFLGSGTTLIAAHRTGRRCYGCEIEPRYGDVILRRAEAEGLAVVRME